MNFDNTLATFGSDGGGEFKRDIDREESIGYSDGSFAAKWEPFATAEEPIVPQIDDKIRGMSYGYFANRGEITSKNGLASQRTMFNVGFNWTCLTVVNYQESYHSTNIFADHLRTPSDHDIESFVNAAHERGVKVCLKPMVHSQDNVWRAFISFPSHNMDDIDAYWKPWFESYKNFILHYAELAQKLGVEMFCIGCEMLGTEHREADWRYIISEVRRVYTGIVIYNTNHDHEDTQGWFDSLDYIGTSAYYPVGDPDNSYDDMVKKWTEIRYRLDAIAASRNKQFIFMEIGCRSVEGASAHPWDFNYDLPYSEEEQYNFYKSCMDVFYDDPYFAGVFWWDWPTYLPTSVGRDLYIHNKLTERYLHDFNAAKRQTKT